MQKTLLKFSRATIFFCAGVLFSFASPLIASQFKESSARPLLIARASGMSLDQAVNQVRQQTGGRVLAAKTVSKGGRKFHRIKVLMPSGRVKIIRMPAN